jgi:hypothetical protein
MGIHEYAEKRSTLGTQDTCQRQTKLNTTTQQKTIKIVATEPIQGFAEVLTTRRMIHSGSNSPSAEISTQ